MEDIISQRRNDALANMENVPNKEKRLVIFSDYGLDDACAAAYILDNRNEYDNIDVMPIAGNVVASTAMDNAKKLLGAARDHGVDLRGVRLVDSVDYYQNSCMLPHIHGEDGMGDLFDSVESSPVPVVKYGGWVKSIGEGYRILSLGPCTMVKRTLADATNIPGGRIVIMGGCTRVPPNFGKYEFNDGIDHGSFLWTLRRPHVAATLDTCHVPAFDIINTRRSGGKLIDTLMNRRAELAKMRGDNHNYIYDQVAALYLIHPEMFGCNEVFIAGICRNMYELYLKDEYADKGYCLD